MRRVLYKYPPYVDFLILHLTINIIHIIIKSTNPTSGGDFDNEPRVIIITPSDSDRSDTKRKR